MAQPAQPDSSHRRVDSAWLAPSTGDFQPIRQFIDNSDVVGIISQSILRGFVGYQFSNLLLSTINPLGAAALTVANWGSSVIGTLVNVTVTDEPFDNTGIAAITKLALTLIQAAVCAQFFSISFTTFASVFLISEVANGLVHGAISAMRNTIDPCFLSSES